MDEAVGFGGLDHTVKYGAGSGALSCVGKQPVFTTNHEGFDSAFRSVVVDVDLIIR
jgi:hypothetical protein